jgi:hypothetical protein
MTPRSLLRPSLHHHAAALCLARSSSRAARAARKLALLRARLTPHSVQITFALSWQP